MKYGMPYMGSKNGIAEWVVDHIPSAPTLHDLFGGGGAISHRAILSAKFRHVHYNDIMPINKGFEVAANGGFSTDELSRWIDRSEYHRIKDTDYIAAFCWTFGYKTTNRRYLYAVEMEPFKKAFHSARIFGDSSALSEMGVRGCSRGWIIEHLEEVKANYSEWYLRHVLHSDLSFSHLCRNLAQKIQVKTAELQKYLTDALRQSGLTAKEVGRRLGTNMERHYFGRSQWSFPTAEHYARMQEFMPLPIPYSEIEGLDDFNGIAGLRIIKNLHDLNSFHSLENHAAAERVASLAKLKRFAGNGRLTFSIGSYTEHCPSREDVIYCDIPYRGTAEYHGDGFDHFAFYDWAERQSTLVIVSEYSMPEDRFECVAQCEKRNILSGTSNKLAIERLYVPKSQVAEYRHRMGFLF